MGQLIGFPCKNDFNFSAIVFCCSFQGDRKQQSTRFMLSQASKCLLPCYSHAAYCSDLRVPPVRLRARKGQLCTLPTANIITKIWKNCSDLCCWGARNLNTVLLFKVNTTADSLKLPFQLFAIDYSSRGAQEEELQSPFWSHQGKQRVLRKHHHRLALLAPASQGEEWGKRASGPTQ